MNTAPQVLDPHVLAAEDLLSVMIHSDELCIRAETVLRLHYAWMPTPMHANTYRAIMALRSAGVTGSLHDTLVLDMAKAQFGWMLNLDWYNVLFAEGIDKYEQIDGILADNFNANAEIVTRYGRAKALRKAIDKWGNDLKTGKSAQNVLKEMSDVAAFAGRTTAKLENVHADSLANMARVVMASKPQRGYLSGVPLVDTLTGGIGLPRFWQIAGAYKQRKTTLALNIILSILMQGGSVGFLSREMLRDQVAFNLIAMLAVAWLRKGKHYSDEIVAKTGERVPVSLISADNLRRAGDGYKHWNSLSRDAVDAGLEMLAGFGKRLRIYDVTPDGGALSDMHSAESMIKRDKLIEGADLYVADYAGLFGAEGTTMAEQYEYRARKFQAMIGLGTPILVLVQRTEEAVKRSAEADDESHSPGAFGGGAFPAAADYLMLVRYEEIDGNRESNLTVTMKNTRHSPAGKETYQMHSPSGLLTCANWIAKL